MPVLIEGAVDLTLVAGVLVCIGMLMAIQHTFVPMLSAIANFNTHIPGIGKPFAGIGNRVVNKINNALEAGINASHRVIANLFAGLVWSWEQLSESISIVAQDAEDALAYLVNRKIPSMIAAQIRNAELVAMDAKTVAVGAATAAARVLSEAEAYTRGKFSSIEGDIAQSLEAAKAYAATNLAAAAVSLSHNAALLVHDLDNRLSNRLDKIEGSVEAKLAASAVAAERAARNAIGSALDDAMSAGGVIDRDIKKVVGDAITKALAAGASTDAAVTKAIDAALAHAIGSGGEIESRIQADIARAIGAVVTVGGVTLPQVQDLIDRAVASAAHAGGVTIGQVQDIVNAAVAGAISTGSNIGQLVDDVRRSIEDEIAGLNIGDIASIAAATATLAATVAVTLAESGLDRAECREKVKGVCGVNPADWGLLLGGLAAIGFTLDFEELISIGQEIVGDLANVGDDLGGLL